MFHECLVAVKDRRSSSGLRALCRTVGRDWTKATVKTTMKSRIETIFRVLYGVMAHSIRMPVDPCVLDLEAV